MRFIATENAIRKLNEYGLTEIEIRSEFNDRIKLNEKGFFREFGINWKNKDLVVLPIGKETALIFENGIAINGSYEDLPQIKYKNGQWIKK